MEALSCFRGQSMVSLVISTGDYDAYHRYRQRRWYIVTLIGRGHQDWKRWTIRFVIISAYIIAPKIAFSTVSPRTGSIAILDTMYVREPLGTCSYSRCRSGSRIMVPYYFLRAISRNTQPNHMVASSGIPGQKRYMSAGVVLP